MLNDILNVRISAEEKEAFIAASEAVGKPYPTLLREFIRAFNNDTLRIAVPKKDLYTDD